FGRRNRQHFVAIPALGLAYGRVPKAANTVIKRLLAKTAGLEDRFDRTGYAQDGKWRGMAPDAYFLTAEDLARRFPDLLVFTVVREPLARVASCYRSKIQRPRAVSAGMRLEGLSTRTAFPEFVAHVVRRPDTRANVHYRAQAAMLCDRAGRVVPTEILRFETLGADWERLRARQVAEGRPALPPLPPYTRRHPPTEVDAYYGGDAKLIAAVRARFAADYRLFYPELGHAAELPPEVRAL
ncbi:MAG: sulfotransferase family 2 domain-containing protein, partial [Pseudomonadota bacterium]